MKNFGHIFNFVRAKEILEPMRPIVTSLQGRLIDVYFGYKKMEDVNNHYSGIRADIDAWFARMYTKVLNLAELVQSTEERPRACNTAKPGQHPSRDSAKLLETVRSNTTA